MEKTKVDIKIQRTWKKPQEFIVQKFAFDEVIKITKKDDEIEIHVCNSKTKFRSRVTLPNSLIKDITRRLKNA